jgi:putative membrane protein
VTGPGRAASGAERAAAGPERSGLALIGIISVVVVVAVGYLLLGRPPSGAGRGGPAITILPTLNAVLNSVSAALLAAGFVLIRRRQSAAHRACMLAALGVSALFLVSYVVYHYHAGSRAYEGQGWVRAVYFVLLVSHIVLAAVIVPLALTTIFRAWRGDFARHVRIARWTLPIWLYVSVTGVVVYWMLYRLGPAP